MTLRPGPTLVALTGKDERMLPLTVLSSALQRVSGGTSKRTEPDTEPKE